MNGQGIRCKRATWYLVDKKGNTRGRTDRMNGKPEIPECAKLPETTEIDETPETPEKSVAYRHSPAVLRSLFDGPRLKFIVMN